MQTVRISEGETSLFVPVLPEGLPPSQAPVFYNPHMELNRDISIAAIAVFSRHLAEERDMELSDINYIDTMSASGIRGLRISNEVGISSVLNDWNKDACGLIKRNIELEGLEDLAKVSCRNANALLHEEYFHIVDLDPFGTPAPFLDSASSSAVFMLAITATDTAPLCGAHLRSGMRKYAAIPLNNEYHSEMGLRILLGKAAREVAKHEKGMQPLLSHATRHYVRTYLKLKKGATAANKSIDQLGFVIHCPDCGHRHVIPGLAVSLPDHCGLCGSSVQIAGPLWLGPLHDGDFCEEVLQELDKRPLGSRERAKKILTFCKEELEVPFFYDQHVICKKMGLSAPAMDVFIDKLSESGFKVSRTHFSGTSFKTDANIMQIKDVLHSFFI